ncbi:hypothetical protein H8K55_05075 [Undibacterium sp. LX15W]|uniref:Uncharacterized protein n=2 Tax=Undibacterium flavidum TaxID=2762297 RepID=A0ABR6Y9V2_9BURK|nr:hypothetical protein [Undibacterium flavidum]
MRNKIFGAGIFFVGMLFILIAVSILFADHSYLSELKRQAWIATMLKALYGQFATFMEAWLLLCAGLVLAYLGIRGLKVASEEQSPSVKQGLILSRLRNRASRRNRLKKSSNR